MERGPYTTVEDEERSEAHDDQTEARMQEQTRAQVARLFPARIHRVGEAEQQGPAAKLSAATITTVQNFSKEAALPAAKLSAARITTVRDLQPRETAPPAKLSAARITTVKDVRNREATPPAKIRAASTISTVQHSWERVRTSAQERITRFAKQQEGTAFRSAEERWKSFLSFALAEAPDPQFTLRGYTEWKANIEQLLNRQVPMQQGSDLPRQFQQWGATLAEKASLQQLSPNALIREFVLSHPAHAAMLSKNPSLLQMAAKELSIRIAKDRERVKIESEKQILQWAQTTAIDPKACPNTPTETLKMHIAQATPQQRRILAALQNELQLSLARATAALKVRNEQLYRDVDQDLQRWLQSGKLGEMKTADEWLALYIRERPAAADRIRASKHRYTQLCAAWLAKQAVARRTDGLKTEAARYASQLNKLPPKITTASQLLEEYIKQKSLKLSDNQRKELLPLFEQMLRRLQQQRINEERKAEKLLQQTLQKLITEEDVQDTRFLSRDVFRIAMMKRVEERCFAALNDLRFERLRTQAQAYVDRLHVAWKIRHEKRTDAIYQQEQSLIEAKMEKWVTSLESKTAISTEEKFRQAFYRWLGAPELQRRHHAFITALLSAAWLGVLREDQSNVVTSNVTTTPPTNTAGTTGTKHLSNSMSRQPTRSASAVSHKEQFTVPGPQWQKNLESKYSSVAWEDVVPSLEKLAGSRLQTGQERLRRLSSASKLEAILNARQRELVPFALAWCALIENEHELHACVEEIAQSSDARAALHAMVAKGARKEAANKVRRESVIWNNFSSAVSSYGMREALPAREHVKKKDEEDKQHDEMDVETHADDVREESSYGKYREQAEVTIEEEEEGQSAIVLAEEIQVTPPELKENHQERSMEGERVPVASEGREEKSATFQEVELSRLPEHEEGARVHSSGKTSGSPGGKGEEGMNEGTFIIGQTTTKEEREIPREALLNPPLDTEVDPAMFVETEGRNSIPSGEGPFILSDAERGARSTDDEPKKSVRNERDPLLV